jgi:hypothetical protein
MNVIPSSIITLVGYENIRRILKLKLLKEEI